MTQRLNVMALVKTTDEAFLFFWDDDPDSHDALLESFDVLAADDELSFTFFDAYDLAEKVDVMRDRGRRVSRDVQRTDSATNTLHSRP